MRVVEKSMLQGKIFSGNHGFSGEDFSG